MEESERKVLCRYSEHHSFALSLEEEGQAECYGKFGCACGFVDCLKRVEGMFEQTVNIMKQGGLVKGHSH